jgi:hypothetical protein
MRAAVLALLFVCLTAHRAHAYPQYQLANEATCTGCHLSPAGGGLLNENGLAVAETGSWKGGKPEFLHARLSEPAWLTLGGDVRGAAGAVDNGAMGGAGYPMQAEVYASAATRGFTLHLTGGLRRPQEGGSAAHAFWSREHYVMWQQHAGGNDGLYIRAGRMMPVYGLRLAEHVAYTQRFGGYPLYGEAYALSASYVVHRFEVHATGFLHDPIADAPEHGDGAALYAEVRVTDHAAIGAEAKYAGGSDDDLHRTYAGLTGKLYIPSAELLLLAEGEVVHQKIVPTGRTYNQVLGYVLASRPLTTAWLLDAGAGHYTQDTQVKGNYRDCVDVNVHWFITSHLEMLATTRLELVSSGPNGGYALAQIHYRL